ncbi:MAG TPA: hypothetical protein VLE97_07350 [Gaiellaceae bacterium]|nr:hypothetical protein [Gaiellaceae bacterium]
MKMKRKVIAGEPSYGPFNVPLSPAERDVLGSIEDLRGRLAALKGKLTQLPKHACAPPENYDPDRMENFKEIETALSELEATLRWIPGGAYRFAADEWTP